MLTDTKPRTRSQTVWGAVVAFASGLLLFLQQIDVAVVSGLLRALGWEVAPDAIEAFLAFVTMVAGGVAYHGRVNATARIA